MEINVVENRFGSIFCPITTELVEHDISFPCIEEGISIWIILSDCDHGFVFEVEDAGEPPEDHKCIIIDS